MSHPLSRCLPVLAAALVAVGCAGTAGAANIAFQSKTRDIDTKTWYVAEAGMGNDNQSCIWQSKNVKFSDEQNLQLSLAEDEEGEGSKQHTFLGCSQINSVGTYSFGRYEVRLRVAAGDGLATVFSTYAGPVTGTSVHDEIGFRIYGKDTKTIEFVYYTNGERKDSTTFKLPFDAAQGFHTYSIDWRAWRVRWYVDGVPMYETADDGVPPRTPEHILMSLWSANGGNAGVFNYTKPVDSQVEWVHYTPFTTR